MTKSPDDAVPDADMERLRVQMESGDMVDACDAMGDLLGLDAPVPEAALLAAMADQTYLNYLIDKRKSGRLLQVLLANPPATDAPEPAARPASIRKFLGSMTTWAASGFKTASPAIANARRAACLACPHMREPTGALLDKVPAIIGFGGRHCALCGCYIEPKAEILTEVCPGKDPEMTGISRWARAELALEAAGK